MRIKSLFTVPEGTKVTEKAFSKVLLSSICSILLCMACLMSTTWAWFQVELDNKDNVIQIADVQTDINVSGTNVVAHNDGSYTLGAGTYTVTITVTSDGSREDSFGVKNVYMTMSVEAGSSGASAVSEDSTTPSTAPTVSAAPGIYTFCMPFGEKDSNGYRVATRVITLNVPAEGAGVTFALSWVQPSGSGAILVNEDPAVIGDAPATEPTETTAPPESTGTGETTDPSETTTPPASTEATDPPATSEPPASTEVTDPPATGEPTSTGEPAETENTQSTT